MKLSRALLILALGAVFFAGLTLAPGPDAASGAAAIVPAAIVPAAIGPGRALARVGGRPPPFSLPSATGGPSTGEFRLAEHLGQRPVVILFWATWCVPCQQELPFYQSLYARYRERGLRIVGISMDDSRTVMRAGPAARRLGVTFDVVTDLDTRVTTQLNPRRSAPFSIWVDREGRITWEREGFAPSEQPAIAAGIAELVGGG
jgi:cytochrome c biogenesis protein CcmG, thiol:disulfide interchange protein DsbE